MSNKILPEDRKIFDSLHGVMIVEAKHLSTFTPKTAKIRGGVYSWRVHSESHHLKYAKPGHIATVWDAGGKSPVVITKIYIVTGSIAVKAARNRLKPVINCWNETYAK